MTRFFIVRHGNTFAADQPSRRIGIRTDLPLAPSGVAQAEALRQWFVNQGIRFGRAIAGPLQRTRQTAELILAGGEHFARLEAMDWLGEIDHGPDEDQPEDVVLARLGPAALHAWDTDGRAPPGWSVDADARLSAWRALLAEDELDTLIVTSTGAARFALLAHPALRAAGSLKLRTGTFTEITRASDGTLALNTWDQRP